MKKAATFILIGLLAFPLSSFAAYPVFDATNNLLATLQKTMDSAFQTVQKANMSTLIQQGKDVVIDFSFWSKENRNFYKELIQKAGAETELVYMKASKELLQKRLYKRNQVLNANSPFVITDEILEHHYHAFQEPCGEGEKVILQKIPVAFI